MISIEHAGPISTIRMSRPPVNAIDADMVEALHGAFDAAEKAVATAVVIESDQKCFSAGADLGLIQSWFGSDEGVERMVGYVTSLHRLYDRLEALEAVTIASVGGPALGGGLELALSCDLRIASRSAKIGLPEARVGMIPGAGGTQRLTRLAGRGVASRLILGGEVIDGGEAERLGIVQWAVADGELAARTRAIAERVAGLSRPALVESKDCIAAYFDPAVDGFRRELEKPAVLMRSDDARQRIAAFFAKKNK